MAQPIRPEWDPATLKHLEFIQAVIARLGQNGSVAKGWAITVAGAFVGLAVQAHNPALALVSLATTSIFWGLDAYFLYCERQFRRLYARVLTRDPTLPVLCMNATERSDGTHLRHRFADWARMLFRVPILLTYVGLTVMAVLVAVLVPPVPGSAAPTSSAVSTASPVSSQIPTIAPFQTQPPGSGPTAQPTASSTATRTP